MKEVTPFVWAIPAAMLIIALAPLPYGYYTLLRIVVCGASAFLAWQHYTLEGQIELCPKVGDGQIRRRVWLA